MLSSLAALLPAGKWARRAIGVGGFFCVLLLLFFLGRALISSGQEQAREAGATSVQLEAAEEGLKHAENANTAEQAVTHDRAWRREQCMQHSRTPEYCE